MLQNYNEQKNTASEAVRRRKDKKMPLEYKYFVLKPRGGDEYAKASRAAMLAYANAISDHDPELADQLGDWVNKEATWDPSNDST